MQKRRPPMNPNRMQQKPFPKKKLSNRNKKRRGPMPTLQVAPKNDMENTGLEALYFRSLIDSEIPVVVVMSTGEELRGYVRYYDKDVFSLGQFEGPKLFLRKSSVRYLYEE